MSANMIAANRLRAKAKKASEKAWLTDEKSDHEKAIEAHDEANRVLWDVINNANDRSVYLKYGKLPEEHTREEHQHRKRIAQKHSEACQQKLGKWSTREVMRGGRPPETLNVLDDHGGFTAETTPNNTLWRPGSVLKKGNIGLLEAVAPRSFYQNNNDVTKATYKVSGYRYPVLAWFDNATGHRIA